MSPDASESGGRNALLVLMLVAATLFAFWPAAGHGFVNYDDPTYVTGNEVVRQGLTLDGVRWAFTAVHGSNWHPLTWLSHMLDVELFGLERPGAHHLVSIGLHALNAGLLLVFLLRTTGRRTAAFAAAGLFALHPLRVESVAWVAERKDVLAGTFWMLTLLAHAAWVRRPSAGRRAAVVLLLALGLLVKPMLVTLPAVLLLLDVWPLGRLSAGTTARALVREKLPLLGLAAASAVATVVAQRAGGAVAELAGLPLGLRLENAAAAYGTYLVQTVWPAGLTCFYPHAGVVAADPVRSLLPRALLGAALLVALTALVLARRRAQPYLPVGWLIFVGTLVPVVGVVQVGMQAHADRYTYLPSIGIALALAFAADGLARARPGLRAAFPAAVTLVLAVLLFATRRQAEPWRDSTALWERALAVTERNWIAHGNLGAEQLARGEYALAAPHLRAAVEIHGADLNAHLNLGFVLLRLGELDEAEAVLREAERLAPDDRRVHSNLGERAFRTGELGAAERAYARALELAPENVGDRVQLGMVRLRRGDLAGARACFEVAAGRAPRDAEPRFGLGVVALEEDRLEDARTELEAALERDPAHGDARRSQALVHERLAWILATTPDEELRDPDQALELAERAHSARPRSAAALEALAAALAATGRFPEAAARQREALDRLPEGRRDAAAARLALYESGRVYVDGP